MTVNRIKIKREDGDKKVTIPIATDFDESLIEEKLILQKVFLSLTFMSHLIYNNKDYIFLLLIQLTMG
mgnify:CR=1 FL=1